jgi:hypothetical protein
MKYTVVVERGMNPNGVMEKLINKVNSMIDEGWQPIGGINTWAGNRMNTTSEQAMIYSPEPNPPNVS